MFPICFCHLKQLLHKRFLLCKNTTSRKQNAQFHTFKLVLISAQLFGRHWQYCDATLKWAVLWSYTEKHRKIQDAYHALKMPNPLLFKHPVSLAARHEPTIYTVKSRSQNTKPRTQRSSNEPRSKTSQTRSCYAMSPMRSSMSLLRVVDVFCLEASFLPVVVLS